jgi:MFS family permease
VYTAAFAALVVTGARLGDILGPRRAFVQGLAAFSVASLAAGLAPSPPTLIVSRAFQGAAAALMTAQVLSIIQVRFDGERRARAIGAYSMILAVGVAAGQILGGLLVSAQLMPEAWRPALLLNAPISAILLVGSRRAIPPMAPGSAQRLDLGGVALLAAALLALIVPLSFGRDYGWPAWVWPCLAVFTLAGALFVALERRIEARGEQPLFRPRATRDSAYRGLRGVAPGTDCAAPVRGRRRPRLRSRRWRAASRPLSGLSRRPTSVG